MAIDKKGHLAREFRTLFNLGTIRDLTDGQLLERFETARGEAAELAFAALVERHGPMVLRVCRGVLVDPNDAQDAFQATFLVLVKKARGLWVRDSLGPWLHQVAFRTAACARATEARRRRHERLAAESKKEALHDGDHESERILHEEIDRLPERYRTPVVLCDLNGYTHEHAARSLDWPIGTVKSRLTRGRARLRDRLVRRGLAPAPSVGSIVLSAMPDPFLPPALLDTTTQTALEFAHTHTLISGSTALLFHEVLKNMFILRWLKVASVLLVAGASAAGVGAVAQKGGAPGPGARAEGKIAAGAPGDDAVVVEVKSAKFSPAVMGRGVVEASLNQYIYSKVEGIATIVEILPEGRRVRKGEIVCKLDSSVLQDQLSTQQIPTQQAAANHENARLTREIAEIALQEYVAGISKQERAKLRSEIDRAQSGLKRAEVRLGRTKNALKKLQVALPNGEAATPSDIVAQNNLEDLVDAAEESRDSYQSGLEKSKSLLDVFDKFGDPKTIKELESEVARAKANELSKKGTWELEKSKEEKLSKQINGCTIAAPSDGILIYANDASRNAGKIQIEEGATVREAQKLFSLPDLEGPMQFHEQVRESMIRRIKNGQHARITVDAFRDKALTGIVKIISPVPDPQIQPDSKIKLYSVIVEIEKGLPELRPGMTAMAEILLPERDAVLAVPVSAVVRFEDKDHVLIKKPDGPLEFREVTVGMSNEKLVEIKQGIKEGERVIADPLMHLNAAQKRMYGLPPTSSQPRAPR